MSEKYIPDEVTNAPNHEEIEFSRFIVLKVEDLEACLSDEEIELMIRVMDRVKEYRKETKRNENPQYYLVNTDEEYAPAIKEIIDHKGKPPIKIWMNEDSM